jgi:hypothetical protein
MAWDMRQRNRDAREKVRRADTMRASIGPLRLRAERFHGDAVSAQGLRVTPVGHRFSMEWPGGGLAWLRPVAVEVSGAGAERRVPIRDVTRLIVLALPAAGALAGLIVSRRAASMRHERYE